MIAAIALGAALLVSFFFNLGRGKAVDRARKQCSFECVAEVKQSQDACMRRVEANDEACTLGSTGAVR
ncbi:MAG: hypothetical protein KGO96_13785 [Elusimicrobia bacterium]|nr:hypothetical protein [Elusimicrobiota bacterium]MDE2236268.1 hypothetical protein [Elusimicrobiota bacterium]MDE2426966.1 hypothetical protein [Elusimicrobiota bacterium]